MITHLTLAVDRDRVLHVHFAPINGEIKPEIYGFRWFISLANFIPTGRPLYVIIAKINPTLPVRRNPPLPPPTLKFSSGKIGKHRPEFDDWWWCINCRSLHTQHDPGSVHLPMVSRSVFLFFPYCSSNSSEEIKLMRFRSRMKSKPLIGVWFARKSLCGNFVNCRVGQVTINCNSEARNYSCRATY